MKKQTIVCFNRIVTTALCGLMFLITACGSKTPDAQETSLYVYDTATLIRYNDDDYVVIISDNLSEEVEGYTSTGRNVRHMTADIIRTDSGSWFYKDDTLTKLEIEDDEIAACSREGEAWMVYHVTVIDDVNYYDSCFMMDGEERIPIVEAQEDRLMASALFSPRGEAFLYSMHDTFTEEYELWLFRDGASDLITKSDDGVFALKTTDDGSLIWFYESNGDDTYTLYAVRDGEITEIGTLGAVSDVLSYYLSFDARELVFYDGDDWFLSLQGEEAKELRGHYELVAPAGTQTHSQGKDLGVTTFCGTYYYDWDRCNLYRIEEDGTLTRLLRKQLAFSSYALLRDGKTFIIADEDGILRYDLSADDPEESAEALVEEGVQYADISFDGANITYVDEDGALWILQEGKEAERLLKQASETDRHTTGEDDGGYLGCAVYYEKAQMYYYIDDGALYRSADGTEEEEVDGIKGDVIYIYSDPLYLTFYTEDGDTTWQYMSLDGEHFERVEW